MIRRPNGSLDAGNPQALPSRSQATADRIHGMSAKTRLILGWCLVVAGVIGIERSLGVLPVVFFPKPLLGSVLTCCGGLYLLWKSRTED